MSWYIQYARCDDCKSLDTGCKDRERIDEGVQKAHSVEACKSGEHQGGGSIIMLCGCYLPKERVD